MRLLGPWLVVSFGFVAACADQGGGAPEGGSAGAGGGGAAGTGGAGGIGGATGGSGGGGTGGAVAGGIDAPADGGTGGSTGDASGDGTPPPPDTGAGGADGGDGATPPAGNPFVYIAYAEGTRIFELDLATGKLNPKGMSDGAGYMAADPSRRFIYSVARAGAGGGGGAKVNAFTMNASTGALTKINEAAIPGVDGPTHIFVHPSARWVLTAHYQSGHAAVLPVMAGGGVGAPSDVKAAGTNAHYVMTDQAGKFAFVPCLGRDYVAQYTFDAATGKLAANMPASASAPSARHMDLHPSGRFAYVLGEGTSRMMSFLYDPATGLLSERRDLSTVPAGGGGGNSGAHVAVHPSGKFVYGSNRGHNSIVIFAINETTGRLTLVGHQPGPGLDIPWDFSIDATGKYMVVINSGTGAAMSFAINPADGTLTKKDTVMTAAGRVAYAGVVYPP